MPTNQRGLLIDDPGDAPLTLVLAGGAPAEALEAAVTAVADFLASPD